MTNARPHPPSNFVNPEWQQPNKIEDDSQILSVLEAYYAANNNIATKNNPPKGTCLNIYLHIYKRYHIKRQIASHENIFNQMLIIKK